MESAGEALAGVVARSIDSHAQALAARTFGPLPDTPRVAVVGTDARPLSLEQARRIVRALAKLQWPYELCVPDAPANCHKVARLRAIERVSAELVLVVNAGFAEETRTTTWQISYEDTNNNGILEEVKTCVNHTAYKNIEHDSTGAVL